ncbi:hypothetical protein NVS47_07515 [Dehalobacterium formicoaceticum]|uniref:Uncharacterized protein n=1 Tax=Dehalobacterium formicoaceticum TaxID=51515 RepID=A0ABT1Y620_9FIRM|nr:hypothetical protein [Dehalobacterium formicoaceticum]MCR6545364.1 hypothetical protein [Dehalobacterium formicoaceticum]
MNMQTTGTQTTRRPRGQTTGTVRAVYSKIPCMIRYFGVIE